MRLTRLVARGVRNLADLDRTVPPEGVAILGQNGQGKTNLLEAIYYPVLFRSVRGAPDAEMIAFGATGCRIEADIRDGAGTHELTATLTGARRKRITVDGAEQRRLADAAGVWLGVAFLPSDVGLAGGPASERRQYLDRMLALAHRGHLAALARYRAALAQRNSALRQGRFDLARAFDAPLAAAGAVITADRVRWVAEASDQFTAECAALGERMAAMRYHGHAELAEPAAWNAAFEGAWSRDRARGTTTVGPHRDDLQLLLEGRPIRSFGSTGQQRSAAVALKLIERDTLRRARGFEPPLLLDDVFAELDAGRQERLAARLLAGDRQLFITAPRPDELPQGLSLPVWTVSAGVVR